MAKNKPDFSGWAAKYGVTCSDGTVMMHGAFADQNGVKVPLLYQHDHDNVDNIIGHSYLCEKPEGLWVDSYFNNNQNANTMRECIRHGDIVSFSIFANKLTRNGNKIQHGLVREVSLVVAGADPTARIVSTSFEHADGTSDTLSSEGIVYSGETLKLNDDSLSHADDDTSDDGKDDSADDKTVQAVLDTMNDDQKAAYDFMQEQAVAYGYELGVKDANKDDDSSGNTDDNNIKHDEMSKGGNNMNVFEQYANGGNHITDDFIKHCADFEKKAIKALHEHSFNGSFYNALLAMANEDKDLRSDVFNDEAIKHSAFGPDVVKHSTLTDDVGFVNVDWLFPDARNTTNEPKIIRDNEDWVSSFMSRTTHLPYARVRTLFADYTLEELRAKGYTKGNYKEADVVELAQRVTEPVTVYVKREIYEDDVNDITDFGVISMIKAEMKPRLNTAIAEAALIGDGRTKIDKDKIKEDRIRPIWTDDDFFAIHVVVPIAANATNEEKTAKIEEEVLKARKNYKGSGNMTFFTTEDTLTDWRLVKDGIGHKLYKTDNEVAQALRCSDVQTVSRFDNKTRRVDGVTRTLYGIMVNPKDYGFGTNQGGAIKGFEGFDIDYNKHKFLQETRTSGALIEAYSAIVIETVPAN